MPYKTIFERHIEEMRERSNECWPYPGYCNKTTGYGNTHWRGERWEAHRAAYTLFVGPIPDGHELDHLCRNRSCCNPRHLEPVTHRVNLLRGDSPSARQARQTQCVHGHELSGDNLWIDRRGRRHCESCRRDRSRAYYYRRTGQTDKGMRPDYHTHCKRGHAKESGRKNCRICMAMHHRRYREARHSKNHAP